MIQLVKQKKIKRKKIGKIASKTRNSKRLKKTEIYKIFKKQYLSFLWPLVILLCIVFGITIILEKTVLDSTNYIKNIERSQESLTTYDNPYLQDEVVKTLSGKNIYKLNYFGYKTILSPLKKKYPIIDKLRVIKIAPNRAAIHLDYIQPDILFQLQKRLFGSRKWKILEVFSGSTIAKDIFTVHLPLYASWVQNINGIFYDISQEKLLKDLYQIHDGFPQAERIVYMPGSQTSVVFVYKKKVFINHAHDIQQQIKTFYALDKYYTWFVNNYSIDLWSLEDWEVIVK